MHRLRGRASNRRIPEGVKRRAVGIFRQNRRFAVRAQQTASDFRSLSQRNWDRLFSLQYQRVVGKDHVIGIGAHPIQWPAHNGKFGYAGARAELSHQMDGQLAVWLGEGRLYSMWLALGYQPGQAPRRPRASKPRPPKIYVLGGRPAIAVRP